MKIAVIQKLRMDCEGFDLVLAGGVFRSCSPLLLKMLQETVQAVAPDARPVLLEAPPVVGAVVLAMEAVGLEIAPETCHRLAAEAARILPT